MSDDDLPVSRIIESSGVPIDLTVAEQASGMLYDRPFSPGQPIPPRDGYSRTPRQHDFQSGYNIAARPRRNERVAFETLRGLIDAYDIAQMCIWHRIDSLRSLKWELVAADFATGTDVSGAVALGKLALRRPDRRNSFKTWLGKYLYDILAYDAGALYRMRNNAGRCIGLMPVDGTTIAPLLDYHGNTPMAERPGLSNPPAFVQYAQGVPWGWLTVDDLIYEPFRATSSTPYGKAPIESILLNANTDLRFQVHFLARFTEGNVPEAFATAPEGWTPAQIQDFQASWDAFMMGDESAKNQIKWVPFGTGFAWTSEKDFSDAFSLHLMRKTCAAYHVMPQDLGFIQDVNRSAGEVQADVGYRIGDVPLGEHVETVLTAFLQDDLGLPLEFQFDTGGEEEDRLATAQADEKYVNIGAVSSSEIRQMRFGLEEPNGQPVPRYIFSNRGGPIPLSALYAVAGPTDPETGAPAPGAPLPHKPFAPIEGVAPQKPPDQPPLAVQRYPADNPASVDAAVQDANAPVLKAEVELARRVADWRESVVGKAETAGVAADTGVYGSPMLDDDEDEDRKVAKAAELAQFQRFVRARRKAGRWRDFQFEAATRVEAHRLNVAGRAAVRKDAGQVVAAGLAVVAADTGRTLMLQRAIEAGDAASGCWEFPGGCLEDGETPIQAAKREWQEETGCLLPDGDCTGAWASGVYQGYVWTIPCEASVDLLGRSAVNNPDDPDGDLVEALAWWDPGHIGGIPSLRPELGASMPAVSEALVGSDEVVKADPDPKGRGALAPAGYRNTLSTSG